MRIVYIDDSGDGTKNVSCFAALVIDAARWYECAARLREMRQRMKDRFGIGLQKELYAKHFLAGRKPIAPNPIDIPTRVKIARRTLTIIAGLPSMQVANRGPSSAQWAAWRAYRGFGRLLYGLTGLPAPNPSSGFCRTIPKPPVTHFP